MRQERKAARTIERSEETRVIRAIPWIIAMPDDIIEQLRHGENPYVIRLILGVKSEKSIPSPNMITPIGGKLREGEKTLEGAYREMAEETTVWLTPDDKNKSILNEKGYSVVIGRRFSYDFNHENYPKEKRKVAIASFPALPSDIAVGRITNVEADKLETIQRITIGDLKMGFAEGSIGGRTLIDHFVLGENHETITIGDTDKRRQRLALGELTAWFERLEVKIEGEIVEKVKNIMVKRPLFFELEQEGLLPLYNMLADAVGESECRKIITKAIEGVRSDIETTYHRERERRMYQSGQLLISHEEGSKRFSLMKNLLMTGNFGIDILHALPLFVHSDVSESELTLGFRFLQQLMKDMFSRAARQEGMTPREALDIIAGITPVSDLERRVAVLAGMQKSFFEMIAKEGGFSQEKIQSAWITSQRFLPAFGEIIREQAPGLVTISNILTELSSKKDKDSEHLSEILKIALSEGDLSVFNFQQMHELRNEINNADLPKLYVLSTHSPDPVVRYEASRQIFIFFKTLFADEHYSKTVLRGKRIYDEVLSLMFSEMGGEKISVGEREFVTRIWNGRHIIVDGKPIKSLVSVTRKSMEREIDEVRDIFSYSIGFITRGENIYHSFEKQLKQTERLISEFISNLRKLYPEHEVSIIRDESSFRPFGRFLKGGADEKEARRLREVGPTGSKGQLILRRKMIIETKDAEGNAYECEFAFYPFSHMPDDLKVLGCMGWSEKLKDDPNYLMRRVLEPMSQAYGLRSLYEYLFPEKIYPETEIVKRIFFGKRKGEKTSLDGSLS